MNALRIFAPGKSGLVELDPPRPGAGEVLLRVRTIGYCGSDLSTFRGANPLVTYPRIPGHEVGAEVVETGNGVNGQWQPGMTALVLPYTSCGKCSACRMGRANSCRANQTMGVQRDGALAEFIVAPVEKLLTSPKLSLHELALVEPLSVGFHAVARARVIDNDTVAVFGCGAIGLGAIAGAAFRGARVIAIDVDDAKLSLAKKCGASEAINSGRESLHAKLQELTNGDGPEVMVEAVGLPQTFRASVDEVCFAGRVVYIGYAKTPVEYETKLFVMKELDVLGSRNALPQDFVDVIRLLESGKFPVDAVITRTVGLDEAGAALAEWAANPSAVTKIHVSL